ncbi:uncharacterized protein LOC121789801 [Salvia splendens]|uniref:uncharacterized protein LOC121789801 n=1 Tax=Salvia splendens TaxID=180675 RepID=UPI001C27598A|nr:uncharacterized protein LOC121789801 [Salvia splendens]
MRVFKWYPDFNAYCESPIAAIWCNLIGLPIHLYDQSALYAIGKLLGNPIEIDRAMAKKSRLSFARLCIEIDITKAPPEEIILDICGRPLVQQVKWDKIMSYCVDCKHVGHKNEVCYASGKTARPPKRNYNIATPKHSQHGEIGTKESNVESRKSDSNMEWQQQGKHKGKERNARINPMAKAQSGTEWPGPDFLGDMQGPGCKEIVIVHDERYDNQSREPSAKWPSFGSGRGGKPRGADLARPAANPTSGNLVHPKGHFKPFVLTNTEAQESPNHMSTNRYFSLME